MWKWVERALFPEMEPDKLDYDWEAYEFDPKPDITLRELTTIVQTAMIAIGPWNVKKDRTGWMQIYDPEVFRHFRKISDHAYNPWV
jgi:hypothetical protein